MNGLTFETSVAKPSPVLAHTGTNPKSFGSGLGCYNIIPGKHKAKKALSDICGSISLWLEGAFEDQELSMYKKQLATAIILVISL